MDTLTNSAVVVAGVQAVKYALPQIAGWVTVVVAALLGALLRYYQDGNVVAGVYEGLLAVGVVTTASKVGSKS